MGYCDFDKKCIICGKKFKGTHNQKTCKPCKKENPHYKTLLGRNDLGLCSGTLGALQELRVCIDLMSKKYEVFRALSPSSFCDILAFKEGKFFDIEVRTAHKSPTTGKIYYIQKNIKGHFKALVVGEEITYEPELR